MSIRQLQTLVAIADGGSFQGAARRLHMTQSAVSMQMKALESAMRTTLFDRTSRPPVLNANGWHLVEAARQITERYNNLRILLAAQNSGLTGFVRLGVIPSVATHLLPQTLSKLREEHSGLRLQVQSGLSPELAFKVAEKQLDLALITELDRIDPELVFEPIAQEELKVVLHRDLAQGSVEHLLATHPFVRFNPAMGVGRIIDSTMRSRKILVNEFMECDSIEAMISIVKLKLGVTVIPIGMASAGLSRDLRALSFTPKIYRRVGVVSRRGMIDVPTLRAVAEAFRRFANEPSGGSTPKSKESKTSAIRLMEARPKPRKTARKSRRP